MFLCSAHTTRHRNRPNVPLARRPNSLSTNVNPPCCEPCPRRAPLVPTVPPAPATAAHSPQGSHATPEPACLPAEVLKPQTSISLQSISNFMFSLPNSSKGCEGTAVPAAGSFNFTEFAKHFKLYCQLAERKRKGREGTTFP